MKEIIRLENLVKIYDTGAVRVLGLKKISLSIQQGEFVAIMGHSGSGKSTLLNILGCLDRPSLGDYYLDGINVAKMSQDELSRVRNAKLGFVFQSFNLISRMSILKNVEVPMTYARVKPSKRRERAMELLAMVGLSERMNHEPNELSGGQRQRVAIARAIITKPALLLADEPTGALDSTSSEMILNLFHQINEEGQTVLLVTHSLRAAAYAKRVLFIRDGVVFHEIYRGEDESRNNFMERISQAEFMIGRGKKV